MVLSLHELPSFYSGLARATLFLKCKDISLSFLNLAHIFVDLLNSHFLQLSRMLGLWRTPFHSKSWQAKLRDRLAEVLPGCGLRLYAFKLLQNLNVVLQQMMAPLKNSEHSTIAEN